MLMKHQFEQTCFRLGLEDHELDLAEIIWSKCEKAMQGAAIQDANLLVPKVRDFRPRQVVEVVKEDNLSRQDIQFLSGVLSQVLAKGEELKKSFRRSANNLWQECDKANPNSYQTFKQLNKLRTIQRKVKNSLNKVSNLQRKLKRRLGE
jgi:hypothetical protein